MMEEAVRRGRVASASPNPEGEGYTAYINVLGSWLNIRFHGDKKASEQIFIIPFRDGDEVKYSVVRGVRGRQARNEMRNGQDNGLGSADRIPWGCLGGAMGRHVIQAEGREMLKSFKGYKPENFPW